MTDFVLGIDAGGTKTCAAAYAMSGTSPVLRSDSGCGNLSLDADRAIREILAAAEDAISRMRELGYGRCRKIVCGAAGASAKIGDRAVTELLREPLLALADSAVVCSDAELALTANFGLTGDGMLVISGTGSVVFLRYMGKLTRSGGWGHLLGDGGSGYSIGITALRTLVESHDAGAADPALESEVFHKLGVADYPSLVGFVYSHPKSSIADLAPCIESLAESGNAAAAHVIETSADLLAADALHLLNRADLQTRTNPLPLVLTGGCIEHLKLLRSRFLQTLAERTNVPTNVLERSAEATSAVLSYFHRQS